MHASAWPATEIEVITVWMILYKYDGSARDVMRKRKTDRQAVILNKPDRHAKKCEKNYRLVVR